MMEAWSPADPGFNQRQLVSLKLRRILTIWMILAKRQARRNSFIDDEVADAEEEPPQDDEESDPNDCVGVAQLTEDEANTIEYLDFDSLFNRARRRIEIVSDSESNLRFVISFTVCLCVVFMFCSLFSSTLQQLPSFKHFSIF